MFHSYWLAAHACAKKVYQQGTQNCINTVFYLGPLHWTGHT